MSPQNKTQLELRAQKEWSEIAKESVEVENINGSLYAFGSELACLRIGWAFRESGDRPAVKYSENRKSWYFRLEPKF